MNSTIQKFEMVSLGSALISVVNIGKDAIVTNPILTDFVRALTKAGYLSALIPERILAG